MPIRIGYTIGSQRQTGAPEWPSTHEDGVGITPQNYPDWNRDDAAVWTFCAESRAEAEDVGGHYIFEYADSARRHYRLDEPEQFGPGYEHYRDRARSIVQSMDGGEDRKSATANLLRSVAVIGTPDDCMQQLESIARGLALEHLIGVFQYGSMPRATAERSLDLFSRRVAPSLKQIDIPLNL
jgi:alkanesulfonate monooxygenase SsuD/methylene tetrahydromethanopterin reductase-like flavin-dependent oxidoreductase (luciferase family)